MRSRWEGFTLIELLLVIAILGVLASLLLPALSQVKMRAQQAKCLGQLRQIGLAAAMYIDDYQQAFPQTQHTRRSWVGTLQPYLAGTNLYRCPSDRQQRLYSYAMNDFLARHPYGAEHLDFSRVTFVSAPVETLLMAELHAELRGWDHFHFADAQDAGYAPEAFRLQVAVERHRASANYLFVAGQVEGLGWPAVRSRLVRPGSRFVRPDGHSMEGRPISAYEKSIPKP
jgi:prepilin-type N-terminal cleavage/methylation domain-containing protein